jgi:hypothetical protein
MCEYFESVLDLIDNFPAILERFFPCVSHIEGVLDKIYQTEKYIILEKPLK